MEDVISKEEDPEPPLTFEEIRAELGQAVEDVWTSALELWGQWKYYLLHFAFHSVALGSYFLMCHGTLVTVFPDDESGHRRKYSFLGLCAHAFMRKNYLFLFLLTVFGVVIPLAKVICIVLGSILTFDTKLATSKDHKEGRMLISFAARLSKWSFVGAFAFLFVLMLIGRIECSRFFYCYLVYCISSTCAVLVHPELDFSMTELEWAVRGIPVRVVQLMWFISLSLCMYAKFSSTLFAGVEFNADVAKGEKRDLDWFLRVGTVMGYSPDESRLAFKYYSKDMERAKKAKAEANRTMNGTMNGTHGNATEVIRLGNVTRVKVHVASTESSTAVGDLRPATKEAPMLSEVTQANSTLKRTSSSGAKSGYLGEDNAKKTTFHVDRRFTYMKMCDRLRLGIHKYSRILFETFVVWMCLFFNMMGFAFSFSPWEYLPEEFAEPACFLAGVAQRVARDTMLLDCILVTMLFGKFAATMWKFTLHLGVAWYMLLLSIIIAMVADMAMVFKLKSGGNAKEIAPKSV